MAGDVSLHGQLDFHTLLAVLHRTVCLVLAAGWPKFEFLHAPMLAWLAHVPARAAR